MNKRISKENTFVVAILTESKTPFNEEGVDYVHDWLAKDRPELKKESDHCYDGRHGIQTRSIGFCFRNPPRGIYYYFL